VPKQIRTRTVSAAQARSYLFKAEEYLAAAENEFDAERGIAATSLSIPAAINAADALCGARLGKRAAGQDHDQVLTFLKEAGKDGADLEKNLRRLLPMKTKAEYDPDDIPLSAASKAVDRARKCVAVARRVVSLRTEIADGHATRGPPGY
jgi:uncharacterized protein (UPF0332 family)